MAPKEDTSMAGWHLDKRVPIAIIGALIIQTMIAVFVGGTIVARFDERLTALERDRVTLAEDRSADRRAGAQRDLNINTLQAQYGGIITKLNDVVGSQRETNQKLDRLIDRELNQPRP